MTVVIFDLDGTLADTSGDLLRAANSVFEANGHPPQLTREDRNTCLLGGRAMLKLGADRLGLGEEFIDKGYQPLLEFYEKNVANETVFYEGAIDTLQALRAQGHKTAICTNKPIHLAEKLIDALGSSDLFDAIVGVNSIPERKPDPAPIYLTLDRVQGRSEKAILVGDTSTDYNAAKPPRRPS